jgi:protein-L-isoaspartate O-methyltransferase
LKWLAFCHLILYFWILGPYDVIHVGAAAPTLPPALVEQLARPGRMFIPVGDFFQHILEVDKDADGNVTERKVMDVRVSVFFGFSGHGSFNYR